MAPRYEVPVDLSPDQERAILEALERYLSTVSPRLSTWALAGRAENLQFGALQARHRAPARAWRGSGRLKFARRSSEPRQGRGDSK